VRKSKFWENILIRTENGRGHGANRAKVLDSVQSNGRKKRQQVHQSIEKHENLHENSVSDWALYGVRTTPCRMKRPRSFPPFPVLTK